MITLMESNEEDSFLLVAQTIASLLNGGEGQAEEATAGPGTALLEDVTTLVGEAQYEQYLARMTPHVGLVFGKTTDKEEAECVVNILVHAVTRLPEDRQAPAALLLASTLTKGDDRPEERLAGVLNLYGVVPQPTAQYPLLLAAVEYARRSPRTAGMLAVAVKGKADTWVKEWALPPAQARDLYVAFAQLYKAVGTQAAMKEYVKLITAALHLVSETDSAALAQIKPVAATAAGDFIRNPHFYQCDIADTPAVKQLAADPAYSDLHKLLMVMLACDIPGFKAAANQTVLEQLKLPLETLLNKARMVALLSLCCKAGQEDVPYSSIQAALDVPQEAVEGWIIRAIGGKLLEGKIDQVRGVLSVSRSTHQTFSAKEWATLRAQLASWKDNLAAVSQTLASVKPPALSAGGVAARAAPAAVRA